MRRPRQTLSRASCESSKGPTGLVLSTQEVRSSRDDLSEVPKTALDLETAGSVRVQGPTANQLEVTGGAPYTTEPQFTYSVQTRAET